MGLGWDLFRFCCVIILFIAGIVLTTQSFAESMNGDPRVVGYPLFLLFGKSVYNPAYFVLSFFRYGFYSDFQPYFIRSISYFLGCAVAAFFVGVLWTVIAAAVMNRSSNNIFGTARIADDKDLSQNGFLNSQDGIILGYTKDAWVSSNKKIDGSIRLKLWHRSKFITNPGFLNTLLLAPTGSGKGVSNIIPTLLSFRGSMVIYDPKEENFKKTAGYRSTFSHVIKFAPCSKNSLRINPITTIRDGDIHAFRDADLIADIFCAPEKIGGGRSDTESYFSDNARDLIVGAILHIRFSDYPDKTFKGLLHFLTFMNFQTLKSQSADSEANAAQGREQCLSMIDGTHYYNVTEEMYQERKDYFDRNNICIGDKIPAPNLHEKIVDVATRTMNKNSKEKSSIFSTVYTKLRLFEDPTVAYATSGSDFSIDDFQNSEKPISLYLTVPYSDVRRISPVFRLLVSFMLKRFTEEATSFGDIQLSHNLLFMFDEFPTLGCFPDIAEVMGVLRGYGIFFFIVAQSLNQIVERYGVNHPFLDHCPVQVVFAPGSVSDAKLYSEAIGAESIHQGKVSHSGLIRMGSVNNMNFSENDSGRNLFDASDIKRLPGNTALILSHNMQPYLAKKVVYYQDKTLKRKLLYKPPANMNQLYRQVAGLPSVQLRKENIERQKRKLAELTEREGSSEGMEVSLDLFVSDEEDCLGRRLSEVEENLEFVPENSISALAGEALEDFSRDEYEDFEQEDNDLC